MKNKYIKLLSSTIVFLIYYFMPFIFDYIFDIFNINIGLLPQIWIFIILITIEIIPMLFLVIIYRKDLKDEFKIFKSHFTLNLDKYFRLWIIALFSMSILNMIISIITGNSVSNNEQVVRDITDILPVYSIISTSLIAPITEELAYRKTLNNIFIKKKLSIIMSGIIFGLAHVIGTYTNIYDLLYIIPYGLFGSIFMYIYCDSKSIWSTITIHFFHNTLLLIMYFIR